MSSQEVSLFDRIYSACDYVQLEAHPLGVFFNLEKILVADSRFTPILQNVKKLLEETNDKKSQTKIVQELCLASLAISGSPSNTIISPSVRFDTLLLDKADKTSYNIDLVISRASQLYDELKEAFISSDIRQTIAKMEWIAINVKALLHRIKGSELYNEIVSATGIDETNILTSLQTDDLIEGKKKIAETLSQILLYITTHFK